MATYAFDLDTDSGQLSYSIDTTEVNWIVVTGAFYTAPTGQFALTITLQDYTIAAPNPNVSHLSYTAWDEFETPTTLLTADFNASLDNVIGGAGGDRITGHDGTLRGNYIQGDDLYLAGGNDFIMAKAGNDTVFGTGGSDSIYGGDGNDVLHGDWDLWALDQGSYSIGNDEIFGGAGNDSIFADMGENTLDGDTGYDTLDYSGFHNDGVTQYFVTINVAAYGAQVYGIALNNHSVQAYAYDTIYNLEHFILTDGDDVIELAPTPDLAAGSYLWVETGAGNDCIIGGAERDMVYAGAGNDSLSGGGVDGAGLLDGLSGGSGNDIYLLSGAASLYETSNAGTDTVQIDYATNFTLAANFENLTLLASAATARGIGNAAGNLITGNASDNSLYGLAANDTLLGGAGNDSLDGGLNEDQLRGGDGRDRLTGGDGNDSLYGDADNDILLAGAGNDSLDGGANEDQLRGGDGQDLLGGAAGNDSLYGEAGNDALYGSSGNDLLYGGDGNDFIFGGQGRDIMTGGLGADRFIFNLAVEAGNGAQRDRILDFTTGLDKIQLRSIAAGQHFATGVVFDGTAGEVIYNINNGLLQGDLNGDKIADYQILLNAGTVLLVGDLIL